MSQVRTVLLVSFIAASAHVSLPSYAKEFKVDCSSVKNCIAQGDKLTKKRKLSYALEAYRNAVKLDPDSKKAWRKFEKIVVRISEEGGC